MIYLDNAASRFPKPEVVNVALRGLPELRYKPSWVKVIMERGILFVPTLPRGNARCDARRHVDNDRKEERSASPFPSKG